MFELKSKEWYIHVRHGRNAILPVPVGDDAASRRLIAPTFYHCLGGYAIIKIPTSILDIIKISMLYIINIPTL